MIDKIKQSLRFPAEVVMENGGYRVSAFGISALVRSREDLVAFAVQADKAWTAQLAVEAAAYKAAIAKRESGGGYYRPNGTPGEWAEDAYRSGDSWSDE